jgi:hypothetical protein
MRFFDVRGNLTKARRFVSGNANVQEEEVKNPQKLAEILRNILRRVTDAEAQLPPEPVEFEVEVGSMGATTTLEHNMNGPVRYSVVFWTKTETGSYPTAAPVLVADSSSDDDRLVLQSQVAGRAIIRVEPAFKGIAYNA